MGYRVAVASSDGVVVDTHFGHAECFRIIEVDETGNIWPLEIAEVKSNGDKGMKPSGCRGHDDERIEKIARILKGCSYILVSKIEPRPQRILQREGIVCLETDQEIQKAVLLIEKYRKRKEHIKYEKETMD